MNSKKLIVIEGACDGIGKSTQYELLKEYYEKKGIKFKAHHFPTYNSYQGAPVEKYLKGEYGKPSELSPYFINCLYATDRAITWYEELKKSHEDGETILLDRYTTSSIIYQSAFIEDEDAKKEFIDFVMDFEYNKLGIKRPDKVIFLCAPFDLIATLRRERKQYEGNKEDVYERDIELMRKVYESGIFVAKYLSWDVVECSREDSMKPIKEIHEEICKIIEEG